MFIDLINRIFARQPESREVVKQRLQLVLAHDRSDLNPKTMERMREELVAVISRYVEIDNEGLEFLLENDQRSTALVANVPIRRVKAVPPPEEETEVEETSELIAQSIPQSTDGVNDGEAVNSSDDAEEIAEEVFVLETDIDIDIAADSDAAENGNDGEGNSEGDETSKTNDREGNE